MRRRATLLVAGQPACGVLERSLARLQAAAGCGRLQAPSPRPGRVHPRPLRRDGARGLNSQASKSVSLAAAARPGSWLRPTRWAASTGRPPHIGCLAQPNQSLQRTGRGAASSTSRLGGPRPAAERHLVRWLSLQRGVGWSWVATLPWSPGNKRAAGSSGHGHRGERQRGHRRRCTTRRGCAVQLSIRHAAASRAASTPAHGGRVVWPPCWLPWHR